MLFRLFVKMNVYEFKVLVCLTARSIAHNST